MAIDAKVAREQEAEACRFKTTQKDKSVERMDIEQRVTISLAISRYLRALDRLELASKEFNEACQHARSVFPKSTRFIANVDHKHWLITIGESGDFEVEPVDIV
jgi:hypothetical protein